MKNKVRVLRLERGWNQEELAVAINDVLEIHQPLKKITKRNPAGLVDQQTAQRLETGRISLDERWLAILGLVFNVTPNEILGTGASGEPGISEEERELIKFRRGLAEGERKKFDYALEIQKRLLNPEKDE